MVQVQGSIIINQPIAEVFAAATTPQVNDLLRPLRRKRIRQIPDRAMTAGTRFDAAWLGTFGEQTEITSHVPNQELALAMTATLFGRLVGKQQTIFRFEPLPEGTRMTVIIQMEGQGLMRPLIGMAAGMLPAGIAVNLARLKSKLEAPAAPLKMNLDEQLAAQQDTGSDGTLGNRKAPRSRPLRSVLQGLQPFDLITQPESERWRSGVTWLFLLASLVLFGLNVQALWENWQSGQVWRFSFFALGLTWLGILGVWGERWLGGTTSKRTVAARALRQFIIAGDERVVPQAANQPTSQSTFAWLEAMPGVALKQPTDVFPQILTPAFVLAGVLLVGWLLGGLFLEANPYKLLILWLATAGMLLGAGAFIVLPALRRRRGSVVMVNDQGLRWKQTYWWGQKQLEIAWQDARTFFTFPHQQEGVLGVFHQHIYALEAPNALLAWQGTSGNVEQHQAHEWLCTLIVRHTRLPLRDLSACVEAAKALPWTMFTDQVATQSLLHIPVLQPRRTWRQWLGQHIGMVPLLLAGLSYGVWFGLSMMAAKP